MANKIKAFLIAFLVAIMTIAWPLFLTVGIALGVGYTIFRLIRMEQEQSQDK